MASVDAAKEEGGDGDESKTVLNLSPTATEMDGLLSRRKEIPEDLACFLQQQKQRQARLETTMRSFPTQLDVEMEKQEMINKRKRNISEVKMNEDPMSHRIIEKRRRDRMNNCLADLSRLVPTSYMKKGRGRIEKTEIIEMAIKHIKHLQNHPCTKPEGCELAMEIETGLSKTSSLESFRVGYHECLTETMHFLVEKEGMFAGNSFCVRLMSHLQKHFDRLGRASTSELHSSAGRTWAGTVLPAECRSESFVKSEQGSEESSGYSSLVREDELGQDLSLGGAGEQAGLGELQDSGPVSDLGYTAAAADLGGYKFKSNIRHRFDSSHEPGMAGEQGGVRERPPSPPAPPSPAPFPPAPVRPNLPVFALSTKGSHYVPLTLDTATLAPFLPLLVEEPAGPLHPVTISVNFTAPPCPPSSTFIPPRHPPCSVIQQQPSVSVIKHWRDAP